MIDPPKRIGYRLTYNAECMYDNWKEIGGCTCFLNCAPCSSCTDEGNPISLEENDEAWELDEEVENMSRSEITDKGGTKTPKYKVGDKVRLTFNNNFTSCFNIGDILEIIELTGENFRCIKIGGNVPQIVSEFQIELVDETKPKSPWFGFKYKVTPEESKLLQEAVFKHGGSWMSGDTQTRYLTERWLSVSESGKVYCGADSIMPEKDPPRVVTAQEVKKDFVVGKYYKCVGSYSFIKFVAGRYYKLAKINGGLLFTEDMYNYIGRDGFDINSELDYDPNTKESVAKDVETDKMLSVKYDPSKVTVCVDGREMGITAGFMSPDQVKMLIKPNDFSITKEEVNMSIQRKSVKVELFDNDQGLPVEHSLVGSWVDYVTEDSDSVTIQEIISTGEVSELLVQHNAVRIELIDDEILTRTGNAVNLRPVKLKNLTWLVDGRKVN